MMDVETLMGEDGQLKPEVVERAKALVTNIAELCKDEEPALVLFVLEAAMTEQIGMFAPSLSDLFVAMMRAYKQKASMLLTMLELLKSGKVSIEDIKAAANGIEEPFEDTPTPEPFDAL